MREEVHIRFAEVKNFIENLPEKKVGFTKSGYYSRSEAEKIVRPILEELNRLGAISDWEYDYGDMD